jgi:hypothetical protein
VNRDEKLDALLGAYALDALDDDEREAVEAYLEASPEARSEARRLDLAVDALAGAENDPAFPEGSWERIRAAMTGADTVADLPPLRLPAPPASSTAPSPAVPAVPTAVTNVVPIERARRRPNRLVAAALAAAAALVVGIGVGAVAAREGASSSELSIEQLAGDALKDPDARVGTLSGPGTPGVRAVVDPGGRGYLFADDLPSLPSNRTYQLWTLDGPTPVSLAVLGPDPSIVAFPAGDRAESLAITDEPAPGATAPGQDPLAQGTLA